MPETESLSRKLPGEPAAVRAARHALQGFMGDGPRRDDAALIVSELATNAVRHSASREAGGHFDLLLEARPGWLLIKVVDQGAPTRSARVALADEDESLEDYYRESGRGLSIVEQLSDKCGHEQHPDRAVWWAELWTDREA